MVVRFSNSRKSPVKTAETIHYLIENLKSSLEIDGELAPELWCPILNALYAMADVIMILKSDMEE